MSDDVCFSLILYNKQIAKYCESCAPSFDQQQKVYEQLYADVYINSI